MNMELDHGMAASAVGMIKAGLRPEEVVQLIYRIGYMAGALEMAKVGTEAADALRKAA